MAASFTMLLTGWSVLSPHPVFGDDPRIVMEIDIEGPAGPVRTIVAARKLLYEIPSRGLTFGAVHAKRTAALLLPDGTRSRPSSAVTSTAWYLPGSQLCHTSCHFSRFLRRDGETVPCTAMSKRSDMATMTVPITRGLHSEGNTCSHFSGKRYHSRCRCPLGSSMVADKVRELFVLSNSSGQRWIFRSVACRSLCGVLAISRPSAMIIGAASLWERSRLRYILLTALRKFRALLRLMALLIAPTQLSRQNPFSFARQIMSSYHEAS